jgi:hypothetical protein
LLYAFLSSQQRPDGDIVRFWLMSFESSPASGYNKTNLPNIGSWDDFHDLTGDKICEKNTLGDD